MGVNQSHGEFSSHDRGWTGTNDFETNKGHYVSGNYHNQKLLERQRKSKAKPNPPVRLKFLDITQSSITLSWQAPHEMEGHSIIAYTVEIATVYSGRDGLWKILTKSCQGTTYEARYLEPNTDYVFRVRSENIYGVGKSSVPSEVCTTKIFETSSSDVRAIGGSHSFSKCVDESAQSMKRHYSFNMHIGGGLKSMLNHSDIIVESSPVSSHSPSTFTSDKAHKPHTLLRSNIHRTSLPSSRKISAPLLLPGTRNNSLNRLRESHRSLRTDIPDAKVKTSSRDSGISGIRESLTVFDSSTLDIRISKQSAEDCKKKNKDIRNCLLPIQSSEIFMDGDSGKGSKNSLCDSSKVSDNQSMTDSTDTDLVINTREAVSNRDNDNNRSDNMDVLGKVNKSVDDICLLKEGLRNLDLCDGKLKFCEQRDKGNHFNDTIISATDSQKGYYDSLDNPWERHLSVNSVSEQIMTAPLSDDVKMALYTKNHPGDHRFMTDGGDFLAGPKTGEATDFRTLRNMLQSNNLIVKTSRSLPDVVAVVTVNEEARTVIKGKLTTIMDANEEDDAVRITTL